MNVQKYLPQERESMQIRHSGESREKIIKRTFAGKKVMSFQFTLFQMLPSFPQMFPLTLLNPSSEYFPSFSTHK
jgi:hypothetical protein